jgi:hypothetical protein
MITHYHSPGTLDSGRSLDEAPPAHIRVQEAAPELHVSPTGDDSFDGRWDRPKLTPQAAIDSLGDTTTLRSGTVRVHGTIDLSSTLLVSRRSVAILGDGPGIPGSKGTLLRWTGAAGVPMVELDQVWGGRIQGLRLVKGSGAGIPSAALRLRAFTGQANPNTKITAEQLFIGPMGSYDPNPAETHFDVGLLVDGDNLNNDMSVWDNLRVVRCTTGVDITDTQNAGHNFRDLLVQQYTTGFRCSSKVRGESWYFLEGTGYDLDVRDDGHLVIDRFASEFGARFARLGDPSAAHLSIRGGQWQRHASFMAADGLIINAENGFRVNCVLDEFRFPSSGTPPTPIIRIKPAPTGAQKKTFIFRGNHLDPSWLDMDLTAPSNANDERYIEIIRYGTVGGDAPIHMRNLLKGGTPRTVINASRWDIPELGLDVVATASLPAAGASMDGRTLIEDNGAGDRNLIIYAGGERFRIDGGAAF